MSIKELLKDFVERTTKNLVDNPDEVFVDVLISTKSVVVHIKTAKSDCGKVIGKKGRTIEAMKILTLAIKNTHRPDDTRRVSLEILEDESSPFGLRN